MANPDTLVPQAHKLTVEEQPKDGKMELKYKKLELEVKRLRLRNEVLEAELTRIRNSLSVLVDFMEDK